MSWYCIHSKAENKAKCVVNGNNILDALNNNPNVIRYYIGIGKKAKNIHISIDETNDKTLGEYVITVKYSCYKLNGKKEGDYEMVLWLIVYLNRQYEKIEIGVVILCHYPYSFLDNIFFVCYNIRLPIVYNRYVFRINLFFKEETYYEI